MYKVILRTSYHNNAFELTPSYSYNTLLSSDIILTSVRTNVASNFVLYKGVDFYSSLPDGLKCVNGYKKFKRTMKSYLLHIR